MHNQTFHSFLLPAPSKPKFLENLISRVSKKVSQDTNGLINALPLDTDDQEDPGADEPLSPDSEQCLEVVESLADELIACTQRPVSGESCDSGQGSSLLESTCDFSPTSKLKSWSTPTSPTFQGIVKQRLKNFQAIRETSLPPGDLEKSPARKTQSLCTGKRELQETQLSARRFHCSLRKGDERFTHDVMESGYVKALVSRLNKSTSFDKDNECEDSRRASDDVVNGVKVNLKDENLDDWPDEFDGDVQDDNENTVQSPRRKSHSVKDQLKKFETGSASSSISSSSNWRKKSDGSVGANSDSSVTNVRRPSHSPKKDLDKQQTNLTQSPGAVSSNESLTDSGSSKTKTFSELQTQVSKALKRFNHERNKHISSRLTSSSASSTYSPSFQNSNICVRSPPILRRPKSSDDAKPNSNKSQSCSHGAHRTLEKSRSVELDRTSDTASSSPVSTSFDYGLMPLSPAELFDQHWSKSEFSFDDFSDDEGINISKLKVIWCCAKHRCCFSFDVA